MDFERQNRPHCTNSGIVSGSIKHKESIKNCEAMAGERSREPHRHSRFDVRNRHTFWPACHLLQLAKTAQDHATEYQNQAEAVLFSISKR